MAVSDQNELRERPTGDLLKELSDHTTTLVQQEIALAKAELAAKGKQAGMGAGMFGGAGLFGVFAFAAVTTCIIAVLESPLSLWLAAFIVGVVYAAIAGVLALQGRNKVRDAVPPIPEQATESVKEDVQWAKTRAKSGRT